MTTESSEICMSYLIRCKEEGKLLSGFPEMLTILNSEVSAKGLSEKQLRLLVSIITRITIASGPRTSLVKCLIPVEKMSEKIIEDVIVWLLATSKNIQTMPAIAVIQWLIGLLEYGLIDMKVVNTFYDGFFFILVKNPKLEPHIARLIYILTKPEDVTRRQVSRILALQAQYAKPKKHLTVLLSLFKSYKPEHVPEKILSTNVESAWKKMPESLRLDLQEAAKRSSSNPFTTSWEQNLSWIPVSEVTRSAKRQKKLIPTVGYINIGSSMSVGKNSKSIFEIRTLDELGKHQLSLELPCNALSLLANNAGLHILTFASSDYQSRFCYNLYNTLQNAFRYEVEKYSYQERESLLFMTAELSRYMQQEIILVSQFLQNYLPCWNMRDHRDNILALIGWMTVSSFADLYNKILVPLRTMWESSPVDVKCEILRTLRTMITNIMIKQGLEDSWTEEAPLFHGGIQTLELEQSIEQLMKFVRDLITSGLYIESNSHILLSEALIFYEHIAMLEERSHLLQWSMAPPAVIYGGFVSRCIADLSSVCNLLLRYRKINAKLRTLHSRDLFETKIEILDSYAKDIVKGLFYNELFFARSSGPFFRSVPDTVLTELQNSCVLDSALSISNHTAVLPYKFALIDIGFKFETIESFIQVAKTYYPEVANFITVFCD